MKKMVCEICGSQAIKKEHGCFVCKECGTEYSLEDAKKLLVSVDDPLDTKSQDNANTDVSGKEKLLYALNLWTLTLSKIPDVKFWFSKPCRVDTNEFWEVILEDFLINTQNYNLDHLKYDTSLYNNPLGSTVTMNSFKKAGFKYEKYDKDKELCAIVYKRNGYLLDEVEKQLRESSSFKEVSDFLVSFSGKVFYKHDNTVFGRTEYPPRYFYEGSLLSTNQYSDENEKLYCLKSSIFGSSYKPLSNELQNRFNVAIKKCANIVKLVVEDHNKYIDSCAEQIPEIKNIFEEIKKESLSLETYLFLPYEYRSIKTLLYMIDLVKEGKATTWKELANLYDTHQFREGIYEKIDNINAKLSIINNSLITGFASIAAGMQELNHNLSKIDYKLTKVNNSLNSIKRSSFISMWNSL